MAAYIDIVFDSLPPPLNSIWRRKQGGGMYLIPKAAAWKDAFAIIAKSTASKYPAFRAMGLSGKKYGRLVTGAIRMEIRVYYKRDRDIDASIKLIMDALQGILYVNDSQVSELQVWKYKNKTELLKVSVGFNT